MPTSAAATPLRPLGAALVLLALGPPTCLALPWTALHFSTGTSFNHTLAVGDLDGDGKRDVATPNSQASAVTVLLGNGDGTLAPFVAYPTFSEPQDVQMADLTGDGIPDLATPDYSGGGVTVLRGLGDGSFAPRKAYAIGTGLVSLAAVDLNGDGRLDLAAARESNSRIAVLAALADSGYATAVQVTTGTTPHQVAAADFDEDGRPDIAVASHNAAAVSIHLGDGTTLAAATPFACGASPIGVTVTDLNVDGDLDLVVSNVNAATISVLLGNGDGTFDPPIAYPTAPRPRGMDAGDLDGDGIPDLVVATGYPDGDSVLTMYRGVGDGTLAALDPIELPYRAADCVIADMDADGRRDIVATGPFAGVVTVLLNPGPNVGVGPTLADGIALAMLENPSRGAVSFRLRSPQRESTLEIFDLAGRRIATFGPFVAGPFERSIRWDGEAAATLPGGPGVYLARLSSGGEAVHRRFVLLSR